MASTFSSNKRLELPAYNDYVDSWNVPLNADMTVVDVALGGSTLLNATSPTGTVTLTYTQYRPLSLIVSGAMSADVYYTIPAGVGGQWTVTNGTTNAYSVYMVSAAGGASVRIPQGYSTIVSCDGSSTGMRLSISTPAIAAGSTTQVQYNLNGSFAGSSNLTFDGTTLSVVGLSASGSILATSNITTNNSLRSQISGGATGQVVLGNSTYRLYHNGSGTFDVNGNFTTSGQLTVSGTSTMSGDVAINKNTPQFSLNKTASGQNNIIAGYTNSSIRWNIRLGDEASETGSNAGSNFSILRFNDSQAYIDTVLEINRANATASFKGDVKTDGSLRSQLYGSTTGQVVLGNGSYRLYQNGAGEFDVNGTFTVSGEIVAKNGYIRIPEATGGGNSRYVHNNSGTIGFLNTSNAWVLRVDNSGNTTTAGAIFTGGDVIVPSNQGGDGTYYSSAFVGNPGGYQSYLRFFHNPGVEAGAQFVINGLAVPPETPYVYTFKNNGTAYATIWYSTSDSRVKSDQTVILDSLSKLSQIKGITYKRNDMKNMDGSSVIHAGVIAQDVVKVLPECVEVSAEPLKSDPDGKGLMSVNYNGVVALLVNAVNELSAKVAALEAKG